MAASLPSGFVISWAATLDISLQPLDTTQTTNGLVGFAQQGVAALSGIVVASLADRIYQKHKQCIVLMYGLSTIGFMWFALAVDTRIPLFQLTLTNAFASTVMGANRTHIYIHTRYLVLHVRHNSTYIHSTT